MRSLQNDVSAIITLLLGTGLVSDSATNIEPTIVLSYTLNNGDYILSLSSTYPNKLSTSFIAQNTENGFLVDSHIDRAATFLLPFDEVNHVLNGSTNNPISVPYPHITATAYFPQYTIDSIASAIYINGTPQPNPNITVVAKNATTNTASLAFSKVVGGAVFPDPVNPSGELTNTVFGATISTWFASFGNPIHLKFSSLDIQRTNRPLLLELYDINTDTYTYLKVFSAFQEDKPYYEIDSSDGLNIYIPPTTLAAFDPNSTQMQVYFATPVELDTYSSNNNKFFRQYRLPVTDLLPDSSELKIFAISKTTGAVRELVRESNSLVGSLYSLDYTTGLLSVYNINGSVPEDELIAIAGFKYAPPVKPYNISDYTNTVAVYASTGAVYEQSGVTSPTDLPNNLYVYIVPDAKLSSIESFLNASGKIQTSAQIRMLENGLILSDTPLTMWEVPAFDTFEGLVINPIELGTLSRSGYSYTFTANPTADSPYERLLNLAATMPLITQSTFTTEKTTEKKSLPAADTLIIPIDFIHPNATEITLFGLTGKLLITDSADETVTKQYDLELGYYDHLNAIFSPIQTLAALDAGLNGGYINITEATFPNDFIWHTINPTTSQYLALRITVTDAAGEVNFSYDYDLSVYLNIKY